VVAGPHLDSHDICQWDCIDCPISHLTGFRRNAQKWPICHRGTHC